MSENKIVEQHQYQIKGDNSPFVSKAQYDKLKDAFEELLHSRYPNKIIYADLIEAWRKQAGLL